AQEMPPPLPDEQLYEQYATGVVLSVEEQTRPAASAEPGPLGDVSAVLPSEAGSLQKARIRLRSGPQQGRIVSVENYLGDHPAFSIYLVPGDRVLVNIEPLPDGQYRYYVADRHRLPLVEILLGV